MTSDLIAFLATVILRAFLIYGFSDVLHPNRANVSKDELRSKLAELYKADKKQVTVFGFRTQYGGGKSTGFALIYDSEEALKKFEPHYRLVRIGVASKIEKPSRQQRTWSLLDLVIDFGLDADGTFMDRQAAQESCQDTSGHCEGQGCGKEEGQEIEDGFSSRIEFVKDSVRIWRGPWTVMLCIHMRIAVLAS